jgi:3-oxoacyl-[acyl-carrier protein] reductase
VTVPPFLSLEDRVAIVTGAGRGIGAATARLFADAGARVALVDRDGSAASAVAGEIASGRAGRAFALTVDVADRAAAASLAASVLERWGRIDILVNNAGIVRDATLAKVAEDDWSATLATNLGGAVWCTQAVVPHMRAAGFGRILCASSVVARMGNFGQTSYAAAKAGLIGVTRVWARELGLHGITANVVAPGFIDTSMVDSVPPQVLEQLLARTAARRLGTPAEVAATYLFLATPLASFVNGAVVGVDGGLLL